MPFALVIAPKDLDSMPKTPALPPHVTQHESVRPVADKLAALRARLATIERLRDDLAHQLNLRALEGTAPLQSVKLSEWLQHIAHRRADLQAAARRRSENMDPAGPVQEQLRQLDAEEATVRADLQRALALENLTDRRQEQVDTYLKTGAVETATDAPLKTEYQDLSTEVSLILRSIPKLEAEIASKSAALFKDYAEAKRPEYTAAVKSLATALIAAAKANDQINDTLARLDAAGVVSAAYLRNVQFHAVGSSRYYQDPVALWLREAIEAGLLTGEEKDVKDFQSHFSKS
jgi:hypothetical protein